VRRPDDDGQIDRHRLVVEGCGVIAPLDDGASVCVLQRRAWWVEDTAPKSANVMNRAVLLDDRLKDEEAAIGGLATVFGDERVDPADFDWFGDAIADPEHAFRGRRRAENGRVRPGCGRSSGPRRNGQAL
jgi:hypothetical protein